MAEKPVAAGQSSFDLVDAEKVLEIMDLRLVSTFLDLACGPGDYSVAVADILGDGGIVYAVDLWEEGIDALNKRVAEKKIGNIRTIVADMREELPLEKGSIDACLMATILHDLSPFDRESSLLEVSRVMKPGGMLSIIEFRKIDEGPGPPRKIRLDEKEVEALVSRYGFQKVAGSDVGEYNYLLKFKNIA